MSSAAYGMVAAWKYPDLDRPAEPAPRLPPPSSGIPEEEVVRRVQAALGEAEQRWGKELEVRESARRAQLAAEIEAFARQRARYFRQVETEVVHLALAVSKKILQREAELDPALLRALVRIALEGMNTGPVVRLRLPPAEIATWSAEFPSEQARQYEWIPDEGLPAGACQVETAQGVASLGLEAQMRSVEESLLAVLARRPEIA